MILLSGNVNPAAGGVERSLEYIVDELERTGKEVGFLEFVEGTAPAGARPVPVRVEWARGPGVVLNPGRLRRAVARAVADVRDDVEQLWARSAVVAGSVVDGVPEVPVVFIPPGTLRTVVPWERRLRRGRPLDVVRNLVWRLWLDPAAFRQEGRALRGARGVVVFSENMRRMIADDYGDSVAARARVVPPGVDGDRFRPRPDPPELEGVDASVAFLGRLVHRKGIDLLLEALPYLDGVGLRVIGDGPLRGSLDARARELGVSDRAVFLGHLERPEEALGGASVLAVPSVMEPFGHVMLEGLASGLPVVGFSRDSGARTAVEDVVDDGRNGVLVRERTARALAAGLREALALAARPGVPERCREEALERYRWDRFVRAVLEVGS